MDKSHTNPRHFLNGSTPLPYLRHDNKHDDTHKPSSKDVLTPKFDPTKILETIQNQKVTVFCGVPTMYSALLAHPQLPKYNLTSIRVCISGASPLPPQVQKHFMKITGGFLAEGYGLTEASPVTHCTPVDKNKKTIKIGSIGCHFPTQTQKS